MSRNYCLDGIDDGALEEEFAALEEEIALEQMDSKSTKKMLDEFSTISVPEVQAILNNCWSNNHTSMLIVILEPLIQLLNSKF